MWKSRTEYLRRTLAEAGERAVRCYWNGVAGGWMEVTDDLAVVLAEVPQ